MEVSDYIFKIQELPDGKSSREVTLQGDDLTFEKLDLKKASMKVDFNRTDHFVQVHFTINCIVNLECDRSLDIFDYPVSASYLIIYKAEEIEESEDENSAFRMISSKDLTIDIKDEVRDTILLNLPAQKLHPRFYDSDGNVIDFKPKLFGASENEDSEIDPRWEALKKLKK